MPAAPTRPVLRERYDRRHATLVTRAAKVFARRGYDQTSMQELARSMGLTTGALYHYFRAKEQLLAAICDAIMEPLLARAQTLAADPELDPEARLRGLVRLWVVHVCAHRDHMLVFQQERHVIESGEAWRRVRARRKAFERLVGEALAAVSGTDEDHDGEAGAHAGELRRLALLGMVNHTAQWYRSRGSLPPERIADGYVELVLTRRLSHMSLTGTPVGRSGPVIEAPG